MRYIMHEFCISWDPRTKGVVVCGEGEKKLEEYDVEKKWTGSFLSSENKEK